MVEIASQALVYIYSTVGLIIILLVWIAYNAWRTKRIIQKQIKQEQQQNGNYQQNWNQQQAPSQYQQQYPQNPSYPY